jgi:hypothetical protein
MQCSSQVFECKAFPTAAAESQRQKLTLFPSIPKTLFLLQSRSAPKSVSVYGSPILLVMGAPQSLLKRRVSYSYLKAIIRIHAHRTPCRNPGRHKRNRSQITPVFRRQRQAK